MLFYLLRWTGSGCQGYGFQRTFLLWGYHVYRGYQSGSLVPKVRMHTFACLFTVAIIALLVVVVVVVQVDVVSGSGLM
jgi:hypothetical protein